MKTFNKNLRPNKTRIVHMRHYIPTVVPYTPEMEDFIRDAIDADWTSAEIGEELGRSKDGINSKRSRMGTRWTSKVGFSKAKALRDAHKAA